MGGSIGAAPLGFQGSAPLTITYNYTEVVSWRALGPFGSSKCPALGREITTDTQYDDQISIDMSLSHPGPWPAYRKTRLLTRFIPDSAMKHKWMMLTMMQITPVDPAESSRNLPDKQISSELRQSDSRHEKKPRQFPFHGDIRSCVTAPRPHSAWDSRRAFFCLPIGSRSLHSRYFSPPATLFRLSNTVSSNPLNHALRIFLSRLAHNRPRG